MCDDKLTVISSVGTLPEICEHKCVFETISEHNLRNLACVLETHLDPDSDPVSSELEEFYNYSYL